MAERHSAGPALRDRPKPRGAGRKAPVDPRAPLDAALAQIDLEKTVLELLQGGDKRLKLQVLSLLLPYKFGKPAQRVEATGPRCKEPMLVKVLIEKVGA